MRSLSIKSVFMSSALLLYALPSLAVQTCKDYIPDNTPNSRYTDNGNSTVTDNDTGLMWKQCVEGLTGGDCTTGGVTSHLWQAALALATTVNSASFAGYNDWRVPNLTELESLVARNCSSPSINSSLFPNAPASYVWSSSPIAYEPFYAWNVGFFGGDTYAENVSERSFFSHHVRLVRSGQ